MPPRERKRVSTRAWAAHLLFANCAPLGDRRAGVPWQVTSIVRLAGGGGRADALNVAQCDCPREARWGTKTIVSSDPAERSAVCAAESSMRSSQRAPLRGAQQRPAHLAARATAVRALLQRRRSWHSSVAASGLTSQGTSSLDRINTEGDAVSEGDDRSQASESGDKSASETPAQTGQTASPAKGAPTISGRDQQAGQTQTPADPDDTGVPENPGDEK
jgi:hypothetical protein